MATIIIPRRWCGRITAAQSYEDMSFDMPGDEERTMGMSVGGYMDQKQGYAYALRPCRR